MYSEITWLDIIQFYICKINYKNLQLANNQTTGFPSHIFFTNDKKNQPNTENPLQETDNDFIDLLNEIDQGNLSALQELSKMLSYYRGHFIFDFILPDFTEDLFLTILKDIQFNNYHDYFNIIEILTKNKSNCCRFISNGLDEVLFNLLSHQEFDQTIEDSLSFCCLHIIDFKLQFKDNYTHTPLSFFIQSNISVYNKLNFLVTYSKYCTQQEEAHKIHQNLVTFSSYLTDPKVCQKIAWIICYISKNNIENTVLFIHLLPKIRFDKYKSDKLFLKPYIYFYLFITKDLLSSKNSLLQNPDDFRIRIVNDLLENQNDLFRIASSINNNDIIFNIYNLLKLIYKAIIKLNENKAKEYINKLVDSDIFVNLIKLCDKSEFRTTEHIITFISIISPFIDCFDKILLLVGLIPTIDELIGSGICYEPFIQLVFFLIEKLNPYPDYLLYLLTLIIKCGLIEDIQSVIYEGNIIDPYTLEKCDEINQMCINLEILNPE